MRSSYIVYSCHLETIVLADATISKVMWMTDSSYRFKLKSIAWDYRATDTTQGKDVDINTLPLQVQLYIGEGVNEQIHSAFDISFPMVAGQDFNGKRIYLYKPKQLFFNSWFVFSRIPIGMEINSGPGFNDYIIKSDLIIEIERI